MIVDCVLFHDEWECLEIRVRELEGLVDRHVVVEGSTTFTGQPRHLADVDRLKSISPLIEHLIVDLSGKDDPWDREHSQRNAIMNGVKDLAGSDLLLISDVDEIPRRPAVEKSIGLVDRNGFVTFEHDLFYYRLNWKDTHDSWCGTRIARKDGVVFPQRLRAIRPRAYEICLKNAGWHFGWLGTPAQTLAKIQAFSHQELNTPDIANVAFLETCQRLKMTAHNGHPLEKVPIDDSFPLAVREHPERYAHLIDP